MSDCVIFSYNLHSQRLLNDFWLVENVKFCKTKRVCMMFEYVFFSIGIEWCINVPIKTWDELTYIFAELLINFRDKFHIEKFH